MLKQDVVSGFVRAPRPVVFAVLADFESYSLWCPDITQSRVLASEGEVTVAEFVFPPFGSGKLVLEFVTSPTEWLTFHQVDRLGEDGLSGRWDLAEEGGHDTSVQGTLSWRGGWLDYRSRRQVPRVLTAMFEELASRCQNIDPSVVTAGGRRKVLDIRRRGSSVEVEVGGKKFILPESGGGRS